MDNSNTEKDLFPGLLDFTDWNLLVEHSPAFVCALSGGPDSVTLCDLLNRLREESPFTLVAAHYNHGLRARDSDSDEAFVRDFCRANGLKLHVGQDDVKSISKNNKVSIEMAAREARYEFLHDVAREHRSIVIALGHNRDDLIENLILRLLRGSGGRGLGSMQAIRRDGDRLYIRPLIGFSRQQILDYIEFRKLEFRTDETNLTVQTDRGKIRNVILPGIEKLAEDNGWSGIRKALARSAELLSEDEAFLDRLKKRNMAHTEIQENAIELDTVPLNELPDPVLARLILDLFERFAPRERPERGHVTAVIEQIRGTRTTPFDMPGGYRSQIHDKNKIRIGRPIDNELPIPDPITISIDNLPLEIQFGIYTLKFNLEKNPQIRTRTGVEKSQGMVYISLGDREDILVRTVKPGDRIAPLGMDGHTRKMSDIFIDRKLPANIRPIEPLLVDNNRDGEILAIPGPGIVSENSKVTPSSRRILKVTIHKP